VGKLNYRGAHVNGTSALRKAGAMIDASFERIRSGVDVKRSVARVLTTHCGSLARPRDLLDTMRAGARAELHDSEAFARRVRSAVGEAVRKRASAANQTAGNMGRWRDRRKVFSSARSCS
jgi:hypothetical protein